MLYSYLSIKHIAHKLLMFKVCVVFLGNGDNLRQLGSDAQHCQVLVDANWPVTVGAKRGEKA